MRRLDDIIKLIMSMISSNWFMCNTRCEQTLHLVVLMGLSFHFLCMCTKLWPDKILIIYSSILQLCRIERRDLSFLTVFLHLPFYPSSLPTSHFSLPLSPDFSVCHLLSPFSFSLPSFPFSSFLLPSPFSLPPFPSPYPFPPPLCPLFLSAHIHPFLPPLSPFPSLLPFFPSFPLPLSFLLPSSFFLPPFPSPFPFLHFVPYLDWWVGGFNRSK